MGEGISGFLIFCVVVSAVGSGFQHGYNTGVVNAPQQYITDWIKNVTEKSGGEASRSKVNFIWSIVVSIMSIGGMIGGVTSGILNNSAGRKGGMLINNLFAIVAGLLQGYAKTSDSYLMLIAGRMVIGINAGFNTGLVPMYLVDISPSSLRGAMGSVYQLVITITILASQIVGMKIFLGTEDLWPILFYLTIVPAIVQILLLPICVESPRYLQSKGNNEKAQKALISLRGSEDVTDELKQLKTEYEAQKLEPAMSMGEMFGNALNRTKIIITITIMIAQQFLGINAVMCFSTDIFKYANLSDENAQIATILTGLMNVLMTFVSVILVELAGRKTLLLVGFGGMFIVTSLLTIALVIAKTSVAAGYASIVLVILFVVFFAVGPRSIPWFMVGELFPSNARPLATSISVGCNWTANTFVGIGFLPMKDRLGPYVFIIFVTLQILFFLFILIKVPETKNKTVDEISAELK